MSNSDASPDTDPVVEKLIETAAEAASGKWIVAYGDAFDGLGLVGPFEDEDGATSYGRRVFGEDIAWTARQLEPPKPLQVELVEPKP
jgi:hypothetical protein